MDNYVDVDVDEIKKNALVIKKICELEIYKKLQKIDSKQYVIELKKVFKSFSDKYPSIFKVLIHDHDINILLMMLEMKKKIDNNEIDQKKAEVYMGEQLAEKFLYPVVGKDNIDIKKKKKDIKKFLKS
tara:strand:- start:35 stop:418 length:384 start_codon:yes stop_codon:yes gene_type:complete